jgi:hypothetical protein
MLPTKAESTLTAPSRRAGGGRATPRAFRERMAAVVSSAVAAALGLAPHVLHHAGPLAGAALLAGSGGALLFGAIGFLAAIPFLRRVHRRCGNWRVPGALLALFAVVFSISTFVIGPAINGESSGTSTSTSTSNQTAMPNSASQEHYDHHH